MRRGLGWLSLGGLFAAACWGAARGVPDTQVPEVPRRSVEGDAAAGPASPEPSPPLDLREFLPVLAQPSFQVARQAWEAEDPTGAAREVLAVARQETDPVSRARALFVGARLLQAAGDKEGARAAFLESAQTPWTLSADAELRAGELAFDLGRADEALAGAERSSNLRDERRWTLLEARSLARLERWDEAVAAYDRATAPGVAPEIRLERAELFAARARAAASDEDKKRFAAQLFVELGKLRLGLPQDHATARAARRLEEEWKAYGASAPRQTTPAEELAHLKGLVDRNALDEALEFSKTLTLAGRSTPSERCEFDSLVSKALSLQRKWGEAADVLAPAVDRCDADPDQHARVLFNAGKYAAADGRSARAVRFYAELERLYPENTLADDSRLRAARAYRDMGVPARFVDLLQRMPEDYPDGDMTWEGVLELALSRIERKDWASAALVLERGAQVVRNKDAARGHEFAGCERYFLARAYAELGKKREALDEYETIVRELPLSYYMLHAYSRLVAADPARAANALEAGRAAASERPFSFPHRAEFELPEFRRGLELLRVSDFVEGERVLGKLYKNEGGDHALLWGIALLYDRAGDARVAHSIARGKLTDWLSHYPVGDWERPWQIGFPRPYQSIVERESRATGVPEWFIYGIMREESTFDPEAESPAAAYGLMQLIVPTARAFAQKAGLPYSPEALKRPRVNIALGSRALASLNKRFSDNPWLAIPGYNAGPGRPARWLRERPDVDFDVWVEMIPFRETRRYTKRVLASRAAYAFLYYPEAAEAALLLPERLKFPGG